MADPGRAKMSDGATVTWDVPQLTCSCVVAKANRKRGVYSCKHIDTVLSEKRDIQEPQRSPGTVARSVFPIGKLSSLELICGNYVPQFHLALVAEETPPDGEWHAGLPTNIVTVRFDNDKTEFPVGRILEPWTSRFDLRFRFIEYFLDRALYGKCAKCERPENFQRMLDKDELTGGDILTLLAFGADVESGPGSEHDLCHACYEKERLDLVPTDPKAKCLIFGMDGSDDRVLYRDLERGTTWTEKEIMELPPHVWDLMRRHLVAVPAVPLASQASRE